MEPPLGLNFMTRNFILSLICCTLASTVSAQPDAWKLTDAQRAEMNAMITNINRSSLDWRAAVMRHMLMEANFFAGRLHLPVSYPVQVSDITYDHIPRPWFSVIHVTHPPYFPVSVFGTNIYNASVPRDQRLRALEIGTYGVIETTNFEFDFYSGKVRQIIRLSAHNVERYANNLDALIGKPSLIDTNGAYQLAIQWLTAVDMDMTAIDRLKWTINQLRYQGRGATNYATLPLYYVDFGNKHFPANGNLHSFDEPQVSVEILGTTKELQNLTINDLSLSRRPLLLITNALDLVRMPNPTLKHLQKIKTQTNSPSP